MGTKEINIHVNRVRKYLVEDQEEDQEKIKKANEYAQNKLYIIEIHHDD